MVVTCAVPKCKSGYKSQKEKFSVFKVPRNIEMRKKWEAAIPGVLALKDTHAICEKHFEAHYIIRNYIKHDANGKVIANVPYQRPRLHSSAVPTIFDDNTPFIYNKVHVPELVHATESHQSIIETSDEVTTKRPRIDLALDEVTTKEPCIDIKDEVVHVELSSSCDQQKSSEIASAEVGVSMSVGDRRFLTFAINRQRVIMYEGIRENMCYHQPNYSAEVPASWSVTEILKESGNSLLFTYGGTITKNDNKDHPIIQKCIILQPDKVLHYYVFGRPFDAEKANVVRSLDEIKLLPKILQKFQIMKVCSGIGSVDIHHLQLDHVFQDPVEQWHHKECFLITKTKRCGNCSYLRKLQLQKETRFNKRKTLLRIRSTSNPVEKHKVMAMRKKYNNERRKINRAKARVTFLLRSLEDKKEEL